MSGRSFFDAWYDSAQKIIQGSPRWKKKRKEKRGCLWLVLHRNPRVCALRNKEVRDLSAHEKQHKACHTTLRSGRSAHKRKPGNPPLSLRALFPADLYPLIKTNQGGILHVDSIALRRVESFDLDGWLPPSPPPVACSEGLANLIVLTPAWRGRGDLSLRAVSTTHSVPRTVFGLLVAS